MKFHKCQIISASHLSFPKQQVLIQNVALSIGSAFTRKTVREKKLQASQSTEDLKRHSSSCFYGISKTYLIKADQIYLSTDVDPLWADAENSQVLEAPLCVHNPRCHSCWQCWWHRDGDNIQRLNNNGFSLHLRRAQGEQYFFVTSSFVLWFHHPNM